MSKRVVITSRTIRKRQQKAADAAKKTDKDEKDSNKADDEGATSVSSEPGPSGISRKPKKKENLEEFLEEVIQAPVAEPEEATARPVAGTSSKKGKRRPPKRVRRLEPFMPPIEEETVPVDALGDRRRLTEQEGFQGVKKRTPREPPRGDNDDRVLRTVRDIAHRTAQDAFQEIHRRMTVQEVATDTITEITEQAMEEVAWDIAKLAVDEIGQEAEKAASWELSEDAVYLMSQAVVEQIAWDVEKLSLADEVGQEAVDESAAGSSDSVPPRFLVLCRGEEAARQLTKIAKKLGKEVKDVPTKGARQPTPGIDIPQPSQSNPKRGSGRRRRRRKQKVEEDEEDEEELVDDINLGPCYYKSRIVQKAEPTPSLDDTPYPDSAAGCSHPPTDFQEPEPAEPEGAYGGPPRHGNVFHNLLHEFWNASREQLELDGYVFDAKVVYKLGLRETNKIYSEVSFNLFTEEPDPELIEKHIRVADAILDYVICKKRKESERDRRSFMLVVGYEITPFRNRDIRRIEREIREITADGLKWAMSVVLKNVGPVHKLKISCTIEHDKLYLSDLRDLIETFPMVDKVHIDRIQLFRM